MLLAALVAGALALTRASGIAGLGDTDPYSHLEYAHQLWKNGSSFAGHPYLPFTLLGSSGVDLWWGFHLLLLPFAPLGVLWGARLAGAFIAMTTIGALAWLMERLGQRHGWLFAVAPVLVAPAFAYRDHLARPSHLTIALVLVSLVAGAGALRPRWAASASFVHALLHLSAPLSPLFAGVGWLGARLAGFGKPADDRAGSFRTVVWSVGGLGLGLLLRPDREGYLGVAAVTSLTALRQSGVGALPHTAPELAASSISGLASELWPLFLLVLCAVALGWKQPRVGSRPIRFAALFSLGPGLVLALLAFRFVDYLAPFLALSAAMLWPSRTGWSKPIQRWAAGAAALGALTLGAIHLREAWSLGNRYIDPPSTFRSIAESVRANVPPGAMIVTDDPFITEVIYSSLPEYRYPVAHDPALLFGAAPALFWQWHHAVTTSTECEARSCAGSRPDSRAILRLCDALSSEWLITSYPTRRRSMQAMLFATPEQFELVAHAPGPVTGLYLWRVRPGPKLP